MVLLHCFISSFCPLYSSLSFSQAVVKHSPALPSFLSPVSAEDDVAIISSPSLLNYSCDSLFLFPFLFFSSLRSERAAGRWRDEEEEELEEELEEEVESAGQVERVLLELAHQSVCRGLCTAIRPSIHLSICLCCPSMCPSSHLPSSQEKCPTSTSLVVQNLLSSTPFLPLLREKRE